jgi:hypothetical protein
MLSHRFADVGLGIIQYYLSNSLQLFLCVIEIDIVGSFRKWAFSASRSRSDAALRRVLGEDQCTV